MRSATKRKRAEVDLDTAEAGSGLSPFSKRRKTAVPKTTHSFKSDLMAAFSEETEEPHKDESAVFGLFNRPSLVGHCVAITSESGEKKYIHCFDDDFVEESKQLRDAAMRESLGSGSPFAGGISQVIEELKAEKWKALASAELRHTAARRKPAADCSAPKRLWVDKYKPTKFVELLSGAEVNRQVLAWVKSWDLQVYGHSYKRRLHEFDNRFVSRSQRVARMRAPKLMSSMPVFRALKTRGKMEPVAGGSGDKGPEEKVLLLSGSPGTGKTTLAHVIAAHCGYRVVEINASDDRSQKRLRQLVLGAVEMRPVLGENKPPLIVLDEIDGAIGGNEGGKGVEAIISLAKSGVIKRPIICICNDLYATALRPLRQFAKVVRAKGIDQRALVRRLADICSAEKLDAAYNTLSYLSEVTVSDVRLCLNTLQFLKQKAGGGLRIANRVTVDSLQRTPIGQKDAGKSLFDVWDAVLKKRKKSSTKCHTKEWAKICKTIASANGSRVRVGDGVFENYLKMGALLSDTSAAAHWLATGDLFDTRVHKTKDYSLMRYAPYVLLAIHEHCANDSFERLQFPTAAFQCRTRRRELTNVLSEFLHPDLVYENKLRAAHSQQIKQRKHNPNPTLDSSALKGPLSFAMPVTRYFNARVCVCELIPHLLQTIAPKLTLKSAASHSPAFGRQTSRGPQFQARDRRIFVSVVNTMIGFGLHFKTRYKGKHEKYLLTPDLTETQRFSFDEKSLNSLSPDKRKRIEQLMADVCLESMPSHLKREISHEIEIECMRRSENAVQKYEKKRGVCELPQSPASGSPLAGGSVPNTPFFKSAKAVKKKQRMQTPAGDGVFGARRKELSQIATPAAFKGNFMRKAKAHKLHKVEYPIYYRYVEGYTNAVKRKVLVSDWL